MKRLLLAVALVVAVLFCATEAQAQFRRGFNRGVGRGVGAAAVTPRVPRFPAFRQGFVQGRGFARGLGGVGVGAPVAGFGYGVNGFAARRFRPQFIPVPVPVAAQGYSTGYAAPLAVCPCCGQVIANGLGGFGY